MRRVLPQRSRDRPNCRNRLSGMCRDGRFRTLEHSALRVWWVDASATKTRPFLQLKHLGRELAYYTREYVGDLYSSFRRVEPDYIRRGAVKDT